MLGHPLTGLCLGQSQHSHSSMFILLSYYYYYVTFTRQSWESTINYTNKWTSTRFIQIRTGDYPWPAPTSSN